MNCNTLYSISLYQTTTNVLTRAKLAGQAAVDKQRWTPYCLLLWLVRAGTSNIDAPLHKQVQTSDTASVGGTLAIWDGKTCILKTVLSFTAMKSVT